MSRRLKLLLVWAVIVTLFSYKAAYPGFGSIHLLPLGLTGTRETAIRYLVKLTVVAGIIALFQLVRARWRRSNTSFETTTTVEQQAVLLTFPTTGEDSIPLQRLYEIEDTLHKVMEKSRAGELDGNEIGQGEFTLFFYGTDADLLLATILPALTSLKMPTGASVVVRYGRPGAKERRIRLSDLSVPTLN